ncbi:endonuclease/exonuclease/phosphatase family protein [Bacillus sp. H-16]|uniref:endonuclease/exonuclease/phosphatase family protein n=1 Tax=Alteribacter salitolerans TaxID=2912333 RepID=UPI0019655D7B|nr:endonuclease/exonuclease/phosphatase family protein [Alteribacter salitolerans]MBM7096752.1 endonuclease/exonuclease/phosphatase family protein [Alteribacter salitolerans]
MKLLTLNCHSWQEENQWEKIRTIAEVIYQNDYDVIALQEVSQHVHANKLSGGVKEDNFAYVLIEELKKRGNHNYTMVWDVAHLGYDVYEEGLAILTKHPVTATESFYITESEDVSFWKARKIVGATIRYMERELTFYSCHLGWWGDDEESYKNQADRLVEKASEHDVYFLLGDFNNDASTDGEGYDYLMSKGLTDTYTEAVTKDNGTTVVGDIAGWDGNEKGLRIDYIFTNVSLPVHGSTVIFNGKNRPVVSDHFGVEVIVEAPLPQV